jgi:hypothetical protein
MTLEKTGFSADAEETGVLMRVEIQKQRRQAIREEAGT